ncbi:thioesterase II family protein [Streptomyces sp. NPDC094038]|uniref:thioesterase II family protein n=1 Tax=Streptomyces sp. NPDC094038 TaxID=3366055 RepID=UPI003824F09B
MTIPTRQNWIRRYHPAPDAQHRLVCLAHAGGSASFFFPISRVLSPEVEVLAVQYPGRQDRRDEPFVDTIQETADHIDAALATGTDGPLTIFGHSMGAILAFEVARRLERRNAVVTGLLVSGRAAPHYGYATRHHLSSDSELIAHLRALDGTAGNLFDDDEVVQMVLPAIRADYRAAETYRHADGPTLSCPIHVLTGDADPQVSPEAAAAWRAYTSGGFDMAVFPGGHFYLNNHGPEMIGIIRRLLGLR